MTAEQLQIQDRYAPQIGAEPGRITAVLQDGVLSGGAPVIAEYEAALAARFGAAHAVAVNSGSSALYAVLAALGAGPGRSVALPSFAPLPTVLPILALGASPVLVDNQPGSLAIDADDLAAKIRPDTTAVISVPLWGYPAATAHLQRVLDRSGAWLIEDAAQAHGTISAGQPAGTAGIAGCFSTHDRKLLATGEGGFILTSDPGLHQVAEAFTRLDHLRGLAPAVNFKLAAPLAAIGLARLPALDDQIRQRTANARILLDAVAGTALTELRYPASGVPNYYSLVLLAAGDPDPAVRAFTSAGLPPDSVRWGYRPLHQRPFLTGNASPCPNAEDLARRALHLPVHPGLAASQIQSIAERIHAVAISTGGTP
jgi:dTDP-4-amino-4,6-dideoxygalactose transaminase